MSDADAVKSVGRSDMRAALHSIVFTVVMLSMIWWFGLKDLFQSARLAKETSQAQKSASQRLRQQELRMGRIQSNLTTMQQSVDEVSTSAPDTEALQQRLGELEQQLEKLPGLTDSIRKELSVRDAQRARHAAKLVSVMATIRKCHVELGDAEQLLATWTHQYAPLLVDDRGRRLASDPHAVQRLSMLFDERHIDDSDVQAWREELKVAEQPYFEADNNSHPLDVTTEDAAYFSQLLTRVETANHALRKRARAIQAELDSSTSRPLAELTLQATIERQESMTIQAMVDEATQRRLNELKAYVADQSRQIQQAEEERLAALTQVELAKRAAARADYRQQLQEINSEISKQDEETRRQQLEADFVQDEPEIKSLLAPFLNSSDRQPTVGSDDNPNSWIMVANPSGPVSFGRLKGSRALDDTLDGKKRLHFIGGSPSNFRWTGSFPVYSRTGFNNSAVVKQLDRARELLLKYGDLLVEKGMLRR